MSNNASLRTVKPAAIAAVTAMAGFIAFLDATIVNIAIPSMHADFSSFSLESLSWVINVYNIVFAAFLLPAGRYADRFGRKLVFLLGLALFVVMSLLCAVATGLWFLVAARAFQALGAALIVPTSLALLLPAFPAQRRGVAVSIFAATAALASGIGPALGGLLIEIADWRMVFAVNIPIGLLTLLAAWRWVPEAKEGKAAGNPDRLAIVSVAVGSGAIALMIVKGNDWGWTDPRTLVCLTIGLALIALVARRCVTHATPLIDGRIFRDRAVAVSSLGTFVFAVPFYAFLLTNVLFLTSVWNYSTLLAGLAMTPPPLAAVLVARPAGRLYDRYGARYLTLAGGVLVGVGLLCYAISAGPEPDFLADWLPGALISGIGVGLIWPSLASASVQNVDQERFGTATAFNSALRQLGGVIGVAACVSYLSSRGQRNPLDAFHHVWQAAAVVAVLAAVIGLGLVRQRVPDEQIGGMRSDAVGA
ncbi:DHA2 family efflux MFS transporter permease subunit [Nocardia asteroides]|uniref:DHA2 family efflux MFS transporter permease subunit n=1 Tax=Nocardia asteroides TaxID=1824 RepID=UPI001E621380|nr:DHA2 family efflux MFS transporter permease subunit [Nocardia asteroides]UGT62746.1 DHA2 family efflux MFS transporter permease subunit [Nocardia asteroides]